MSVSPWFRLFDETGTEIPISGARLPTDTVVDIRFDENFSRVWVQTETNERFALGYNWNTGIEEGAVNENSPGSPARGFDVRADTGAELIMDAGSATYTRARNTNATGSRNVTSTVGSDAGRPSFQPASRNVFVPFEDSPYNIILSGGGSSWSTLGSLALTDSGRAGRYSPDGTLLIVITDSDVSAYEVLGPLASNHVLIDPVGYPVDWPANSGEVQWLAYSSASDQVLFSNGKIFDISGTTFSSVTAPTVLPSDGTSSAYYEIAL